VEFRDAAERRAWLLARVEEVEKRRNALAAMRREQRKARKKPEPRKGKNDSDNDQAV
jgi:hypothetical protein